MKGKALLEVRMYKAYALERADSTWKTVAAAIYKKKELILQKADCMT